MFQPLPSASCQPFRPALPLLLIIWLLLAGWTAAAGDTPAWQNAAWFESCDTSPSQEQDESGDSGAGIAGPTAPVSCQPVTSRPGPRAQRPRPGHGDAGARAPPPQLRV